MQRARSAPPRPRLATKSFARIARRWSSSRNLRVFASSRFKNEFAPRRRKSRLHLCRPARALPPNRQLHFSSVPVLYRNSVTLSSQTNRSGKSYFQARFAPDFRRRSETLLGRANPIFVRGRIFLGACFASESLACCIIPAIAIRLQARCVGAKLHLVWTGDLCPCHVLGLAA